MVRLKKKLLLNYFLKATLADEANIEDEVPDIEHEKATDIKDEAATNIEDRGNRNEIPRINTLQVQHVLLQGPKTSDQSSRSIMGQLSHLQSC